MRVIAGIARGIPLVAPRGGDTRPITDRVKETLFAILADRVPGAVALDLYAGSGAIGIEALSRGAAHVTFVDRGRPALTALRANLERTRLVGDATVHAMSVERFCERPVEMSWSLVFLDPPYTERAIVAPLQALVPNLAPGAVIVIKHHWRAGPPAVEGLVTVRQRRFGETMLTFMEARDR